MVAHFLCQSLPFSSSCDLTDFPFVEHTVPCANVRDNGVRASDADSDEVVWSRVQDGIIVSTLVGMVVVVSADVAVTWFVNQFRVWWCDSGVHDNGLVDGVHVAFGACSVPRRWVVGEAGW